MAIPPRTHQAGTFFVTAVCAQRRRVFQVDATSRLFWQHLQENRGCAYLLHAFVIMPEHVHLLLTPVQSLEHAMQIVKGGFARKRNLEAGRKLDLWQPGFTDHRIRSQEDYAMRKRYLECNPVERGICVRPEEYRWSSAYKPTSGAEARS